MKQDNKDHISLLTWLEGCIVGATAELKENFTEKQLSFYFENKQGSPDIQAGYLIGLINVLGIVKQYIPLNVLANNKIKIEDDDQ